MNRSRKCDCLVIGAGPAGLSAAVASARSGLRTILIDKKEAPGRPVRCAQLVPKRFLDHLPYRLNNIHPIETLVTEILGQTSVETQSPAYLIDRIEMTNRGLEQAEREGASIYLGADLAGFEDGMAIVGHDIKSIRIKPTMVIAADGPGSTTARILGLKPLPFLLAVQVKAVSQKPLHCNHIIFAPEIYGGYGWIFPRQTHLTIGIGAMINSASGLRRCLQYILARAADLAGLIKLDADSEVFGVIPYAQREIVGAGNCLLAGDAAGLAHPITGGGIQAAVISGIEAAGAVTRFVNGHTASSTECIEDYHSEIDAWYSHSLSHALQKRELMVGSWTDDRDKFRKLIEKTWVAFPQYRDLL